MSGPSLPEALAQLRAAIERDFPGFVPARLTVRSLDDQVIHLPIPRGAPAAPVPAPETASSQEEHYAPFVATPFQEAILRALDGKALRTDALGARVGDRGRLYKPGGLRELQERGMVCNHPRLGHYRPDVPPPQLAEAEGE